MLDYVSFAAPEFSQAVAREREHAVEAHKWQDRLREAKLQRRAARREQKLQALVSAGSSRSWS
jgi:hypothetical protein